MMARIVNDFSFVDPRLFLERDRERNNVREERKEEEKKEKQVK